MPNLFLDISFGWDYLKIGLFLGGWIEKGFCLKIGIIDLQKIIYESKYGQKIVNQLQKKYNKLSKKIEKKSEEVKKLKEEIEKKSALWSKKVKEEKEKKLQQMLRELKTLQIEAQYKLQQEEREVFKSIKNILKKFAEKEKYDLILDKSQPGIYYVSDRVDITSKIIKFFDEYFAKEKGRE